MWAQMTWDDVPLMATCRGNQAMEARWNKRDEGVPLLLPCDLPASGWYMASEGSHMLYI
jgi:hypothetical protein